MIKYDPIFCNDRLVMLYEEITADGTHLGIDNDKLELISAMFVSLLYEDIISRISEDSFSDIKIVAKETVVAVNTYRRWHGLPTYDDLEPALKRVNSENIWKQYCERYHISQALERIELERLMNLYGREGKALFEKIKADFL